MKSPKTFYFNKTILSRTKPVLAIGIVAPFNSDFARKAKVSMLIAVIKNYFKNYEINSLCFALRVKHKFCISFIALFLLISSSILGSCGWLYSSAVHLNKKDSAIFTQSLVDPNLESLVQAYGFLKGQQFTLDRIKAKYPEMEMMVLQCESKFNLAFGKAESRINDELKSLLNDKFEQKKADIFGKMRSKISRVELSKETAKNFISQVHFRPQGEIENPFLEILLTYQYLENPAKEFADGFVQPFSSKSHPKAKNVHMNAKLPKSWQPQEGDRPNIVQKFVSKNGSGQELVLFLIRDLDLPDDYKISKEDLNAFFSQEVMKEMLPEDAEYISAKRISIDNQPSGQLIYKVTRQQLDFTVTMQIVQFVSIYQGKMVFLQGMVSADKNDELKSKFDLFFPLFRFVANSIVFPGQY